MSPAQTALKQYEDQFDSSAVAGGNETVTDIDPVMQGIGYLFDLKDRGSRVEVKAKGNPYDALVDAAEQWRDFGVSHDVTDALKDAIETQLTQQGADFTRKENAEKIELEVSIQDHELELEEDMVHFVVAYDRNKKYGAEYSTVVADLSINGTKTTATNMPAMEKMFTGHGEEYLFFHFKTPKTSGLKGMEQNGAAVQKNDRAMASVGLLEAAGPRAKAAELEPVRRSIEQGTITPQQSNLIASTANLNRVTEQIARAPLPVQNAPQIVKPVQAAVTQNLQAVTNARQLPAPAVMNAVIASVNKAEIVTTASQKPIVAAPQILKADNSIQPVASAQPVVAKPQAVAPAVVQPVVAQSAARVEMVAPVRQVVQPQQPQIQAAAPVVRAPVQAAPQVAEVKAPVAVKPIEVAPVRPVVQQQVIAPVQQQQPAAIHVQPQQAYVAPVIAQPVLATPPVEVKKPVQAKPAEEIIEEVIERDIEEQEVGPIVIDMGEPISKKPVLAEEALVADEPSMEAFTPVKPTGPSDIVAEISAKIPTMPVYSEIGVQTEARAVEAKQQEMVAEKVAEAKIISEINALGVSINTANINVSAPGVTKQSVLQQAQQQIQKQNHAVPGDDKGDAESDKRKEREKFLDAQKKDAEEEKAKKKEKEKLEALSAARAPIQMAAIDIAAIKTPAAAQSTAEADYQRFFAKKDGGNNFGSGNTVSAKDAFSKACSGNCGGCAGCSISGTKSYGPAPKF